MRSSALLAAILASLALPCFAAEAKPGALIDGFKSVADPSQTYALYLPSSYRPDRAWPLLLVFDPRSRGEFAANLFVPAAERFGWIIASSNNTLSDTATIEANRRAVHATLADVVSKYPIDAKRLYAAGFSGGSRIAVDFALNARSAPAGVVLVGGGFAIGARPNRDTKFVVFGMAGDTDFNYYEMRQLDRDLAEANVPRALRIFEGGHQWPPSQTAGEAVEWMEISAMARGLRTVDKVLVEASHAGRMKSAREAASSGRLVDAHLMFDSIARDFDGLIDVSEARAESRRLGELREVRSSIRRQDETDQSDLAWRRKSMNTLQAALSDGNPRTPALNELLSALDLRKLTAKAREEGRSLEIMSARRRLEMLFVQTSFYLFQDLIAKKLWEKALLSISISAEIKPEAAFVQYNLAAMNARTGRKDRALQALQRALDAGFRNVELLRTDSDLDSIRDDARFQELVAAMPAR